MARHHTATHLLNAALRHVLGDHVQQAGSLVDTDRLRFDFSHYKAMTSEEIAEVERLVNDNISDNVGVSAFETKLDEAKAMGAAALFGEKYEDDVRVIQIGEFSLELCGGTHVTQTGEIETFKLISETAIAAGTRRIEAIAGRDRVATYTAEGIALAHKDNDSRIQKIKEVYDALKRYAAMPEIQVPTFTYPDSVIEAQEQRETIDQILKHLEKQLESVQARLVSEKADCLLSDAAGHVFAKLPTDFDTKMSRSLAEKLVKERASFIVVLLTENGMLIVAKGSTSPITEGASGILRQLTTVLGGKGGGKPDFAQAGGCSPAAFDAAIQQLEPLLRAHE